MISNDPVLGDVKLIAEAWDAGGLYQVGSFPHYGKWAEWNGRFRDDTRNFIRGFQQVNLVHHKEDLLTPLPDFSVQHFTYGTAQLRLYCGYCIVVILMRLIKLILKNTRNFI